MTLYEITQAALKEWQERDADDYQDVSKAMNELADSYTPVYTADLFQLVLDDLTLAFDELEEHPEEVTAFNVLQRAVYERIFEALWAYQESITERDEEPEEITS